MILYHEIDGDASRDILRDGLKRTNRGAKGDDPAIIKTDKYLDALRPSPLKTAGLSRSNNIYAFIGDDDTIIDIKSGTIVALREYMSGRNSVLLQLTVHPKYCYVSDLEKYDRVKSVLASGDEVRARQYARDYWNSIVDFAIFEPSTITRPEVMIVRDLPPDALSTVM